MKEAKFIKNIFYKTIYRTSDDKYKDAIIAFTTVGYYGDESEEFVTLNKIEDNKCDEVWKKELSTKISNYDDFKEGCIRWQAEGIYDVENSKVKYLEPESLDSSSFVLDKIEAIEIINVGLEIDNLVFVKLYDNSGAYIMTCSSDNCEMILKELVANYDKLLNKGKISIFRLNEQKEPECFVTNMTFIIRENEIEVFGAKQSNNYSESLLTSLPLEIGLKQLENNKNINVNYIKIIDGKRINISEEEFRDIIGKVNVETVCENKETAKVEDSSQFENDPNHEYYWEKEKKKEKKIKIFAGVAVLVGLGAFILWPNSNKTSEEANTKTKTVSKNDKDVTTSSDIIVGPTTESSVYTTSSSNDSQNIVKPDQTTTKGSSATNIESTTTTIESSITNVESTIVTTENSTTNDNDYTITTKPETKYTDTYKTVDSSDMISSQTVTNYVTKSTTNGTVTYHTVDPRDTVTAPSNPEKQVFSKKGVTTTKKLDKIVKNSYDDLIVTNDINDGSKTLVLKK